MRQIRSIQTNGSGMHMRLMTAVCALLAALSVLMTQTLPVFAAPDLLIDAAGVLSAAEYERLSEELAEVSDAYDIDVVVLTTDSLGYKDELAYADDYYDTHGYGRGTDHAGVLFLHCPAERAYAFSTCGRAAQALSDDALDEIETVVVERLRADDFYGAYRAFVTGVDNYLYYMDEYGVSFSYQDVDAHPEDEQYLMTERPAEKSFLQKLLERASGNAVLAPIAGFLSSFLYMNGQKRKLFSVRRQSGATRYINATQSRLNLSRDIMVNRTVSKTPIARDNDGHRDGGGRTGGHTTMHTSSSGMSHGGRGGKY